MKNAAIHPFLAPAASTERSFRGDLGAISAFPESTKKPTSPSQLSAAFPRRIEPSEPTLAAPPGRTAPQSQQYLDRLVIRKARKMLLVRTEDVQLIRASGNYVEIITADASHLLRTALSDLARQLDPRYFLRVHRSTIVNTEVIEAIETNPAGDYFLRLPNGRKLKCSRSYRGDLRLFLQGLK